MKTRKILHHSTSNKEIKPKRNQPWILIGRTDAKAEAPILWPPDAKSWLIQFSSVQSLSRVWLFVTPWTAAHQASLFITSSQSLLKLMSIESVMPSNISSSVVPFSSCLQSFLASGSFPMSQFFASGSESTGVSASASVLPKNTQDWFPLELTGWILQSKGISKDFFNTTVQRHQIFCSAFFIVQYSHPFMTTGKIIALTRWTFVGKIMFLLFNKLSRLVMTFLPRSKCLLISWLQSPSAVILEPPKIKLATVSTVSPSIYHEVMGPDAIILVLWSFY